MSGLFKSDIVIWMFPILFGSFVCTKESDVKQPPDEICNSVIFPVVCFVIGRKHLNLQV